MAAFRSMLMIFGSVFDGAVENKTGTAGQVDRFVGIVYYEISAANLDGNVYALIAEAVFHGCHHCCAGSCSAGKRLAVAALPDAYFKCVSVDDADKLRVYPLWEDRGVFEKSTDILYVHTVYALDKNYAMGVAHVYTVDGVFSVRDFDGVVNNPVAAEQYGNVGGVQAGFAHVDPDGTHLAAEGV